VPAIRAPGKGTISLVDVLGHQLITRDYRSSDRVFRQHGINRANGSPLKSLVSVQSEATGTRRSRGRADGSEEVVSGPRKFPGPQ
jgi:hypothetical protein